MEPAASWRLLTAAAVLVCAGCATSRQPGPEDANALARRAVALQGACAAVHARWTLRIVPAAGDATALNLDLWADAGGRVRLLAGKADNDVLSVIVQPDGSYLAIGHRAQAWSAGNLAEVAGDGRIPPWLAQVRLLVDEARLGPVPVADASWRMAGPGIIERRDGTGAEAITLQDDGRATAKSWDLSGPPALAFAYVRWQDYGRLRRPAAATLTVAGDATAYRFFTVAVEADPAIDPRRFTLKPPTGARQVDLRDLQQLVEEAQ